jgi:hypothetical protein
MIAPIFLLGNEQSSIGSNRTEQNTKADAIARRLGLDEKRKVLVRKEKDLLGINIHGVDGFVVLPYCFERFSSLIFLADTKLPVVIVSEEKTFCYALDTYEYLSDHENVGIVFTFEELKKKLSAIEKVKWFENVRVCLFDAGEWKLDKIAYLKNPIFQGRLNTQMVDKTRFLEAYKKADSKIAKNLAKKWMSEAVEIVEPSFADVLKSARVYLAMKTVMKEMKADAVYILWCGQFTQVLGTKMCLALAKLADEGVPVGCWRGENLLPLLILHSISKKPVFACEVHTKQEKIISVRHCFAPTCIAGGKYVLRRWRNMKGTVTGYCQLPKGEVTLVNCGLGDKLVVVKGEVIDCRDLGGDNCRMTVWVELEDERAVRKFMGREFAMVYGDFAEKARKICEKLGLDMTVA